jgi:hypothetical protein
VLVARRMDQRCEKAFTRMLCPTVRRQLGHASGSSHACDARVRSSRGCACVRCWIAASASRCAFAVRMVHEGLRLKCNVWFNRMLQQRDVVARGLPTLVSRGSVEPATAYISVIVSTSRDVSMLYLWPHAHATTRTHTRTHAHMHTHIRTGKRSRTRTCIHMGGAGEGGVGLQTLPCAAQTSTRTFKSALEWLAHR